MYYSKELNKLISIRISEDMYNYLMNLANERNIGMSDLIRYILNDYKIKN